MKVAGLFAGIGGVEKGFEQAGLQSNLLCEIEPAAQLVLRAHFPDVELHDDIRKLKALPDVDVVAAGFPCQDLSQAGRTAGIRGEQSSLVAQVFRLVDGLKRSKKLQFLVLENVPFMLQLDGGAAMTYLVDELENRGFAWAYRVVDTRAFGIPQRRQRVLLVASRQHDPSGVLFRSNETEPSRHNDPSLAFGFYWTEGLRGLGAAVDAVPTLKGGSSIGIPSPPAILLPGEAGVVTPEIRDAERLQGFPSDWTLPALDSNQKGVRWKLVGNAVSVPVARWLGSRILCPADHDSDFDEPFTRGSRRWPLAARGHKIRGRSETYHVPVSTWPVKAPYHHLHEYLQHPVAPLSARATTGFLARAKVAKLRFPKDFLARVEAHLNRTWQPSSNA